MTMNTMMMIVANQRVCGRRNNRNILRPEPNKLAELNLLKH